MGWNYARQVCKIEALKLQPSTPNKLGKIAGAIRGLGGSKVLKGY